MSVRHMAVTIQCLLPVACTCTTAILRIGYRFRKKATRSSVQADELWRSGIFCQCHCLLYHRLAEGRRTLAARKHMVRLTDIVQQLATAAQSAAMGADAGDMNCHWPAPCGAVVL